MISKISRIYAYGKTVCSNLLIDTRAGGVDGMSTDLIEFNWLHKDMEASN